MQERLVIDLIRERSEPDPGSLLRDRADGKDGRRRGGLGRDGRAHARDTAGPCPTGRRLRLRLRPVHHRHWLRLCWCTIALGGSV